MPTYATPRTPSRATRGPEVEQIIRALGYDPLPWQSQVLEVALELLPNGLPAYREVVVSVPRQNGKSLLALAYQLHRCLLWGKERQTVVYGATDENSAAKKLLRDWLPLVEASPLNKAVLSVSRANGKQAVVFPTARIELYGRAESSAHGRTIDLAVADEVWNDIDDRREQALIPAMTTRADAQYLVISTVGTDSSLYLRRKMDVAQEAVIQGCTEGVAYFLWSAPEDAPIDDPATWAACMPAYGLTITEAAVKHALSTMSEDEFRRAYLNQWRGSSQRVIPEAAWESVVGDTPPNTASTLTFGVDISPARTTASIVAVDSEGNAELGDYGHGTSWVAGRLIELAKRTKASVVLDAGGPAGTLVPALEAARITVISTNARQMAAACGSLYDAVANQQIQVYRNIHLESLSSAVAGARRRPLGASWAWGRNTATGDISPLVALTLAYWAASTALPARKPRVVWG